MRALRCHALDLVSRDLLANRLGDNRTGYVANDFADGGNRPWLGQAIRFFASETIAIARSFADQRLWDREVECSSGGNALACSARQAISAPVPHDFKPQRPPLCRPMIITAIGKRPENSGGRAPLADVAAWRHR